PGRPDFDRCRTLCQGHPLAECRCRARGHRRHRCLRRLHLHHHAPARRLRLLQEGRRRPVCQRRNDAPRRQAAEQHEWRPPVRGLYPWHEHGDRERPPASRRRRRFLPDRPRWEASAHLRLPRGRLPAGEARGAHGEPRLGQSRDRVGHGHDARLRGRRAMALEGDRYGMKLTVNDLDIENLEYFRHCSEHNFHLQKCTKDGLLRYPPTTACPWCTNPESEWVPVEGKGTIHSYTEIHHAIQPAFKGRTPYMLLVVDLDTQKGQPTEHEALRVVGNLTTPDGELAPPDMVKKVGIGTRVRMVFQDV